MPPAILGRGQGQKIERITLGRDRLANSGPLNHDSLEDFLNAPPSESRGSGEGAVRDLDVRRALRREVLRRHEGEFDTLVIHELGLRHGIARVDVAVVNGSLHGYELKSDSDTLERLPSQVRIYSAVLDKATLVVGERHAAKALPLLPKWWGVKIATEGPRGGVSLQDEERGQMNPSVDAVAISELLWRAEVSEVLRNLGHSEKTLLKARAHLYQELSEAMPLDDLRATIRLMLKRRENWRDQQPPA